MPAVEVLEVGKWVSLHLMCKVKLAVLAYEICYDCNPPSMGHILTKKTSPMQYLRTKNKVIMPRFNTYFMKNSIAHRASVVWNLLTPGLAKTFNVKITLEWPLNLTTYVI